MRTYIYTLGLALFTSLLSFAQPEHSSEQLGAMRASFITQRLNLTTEEAQVFWPIYNEMQQALSNLRTEGRQIMESHRGDRNLENASEEVLLEQMERLLELEEEMIEIRKSFHERYLAVLSARKVAMFYRAEEEFKRELLRRMRGREGRTPPPRRE